MIFRTIPLFTILGFRIRLDLSWLLLAFLIVSSRATAAAGPPLFLDTTRAVALGMFFAVGLLFSIVLHELAHSLVARRRGVAIRGITLFILGGVSEMEDEPQDPWSEFFIAIVGPLCSFVIAAACWALAWSGALGQGAAHVVVGELAGLNLLLGLFNLVPAFPLDGGRVMRSILWGVRGDAAWATKIAGVTGRLAGWGMIVFGVVSIVRGDLQWLMLPLVGWFIARAAPMPYRMMAMKQRLAGATVGAFATPAPFLAPAHATLHDVLRLPGVLSAEVVPVVLGDRVTGLLEVQPLLRLTSAEQQRRQVADLARDLGAEGRVEENVSAEEAMRRMQALQIPALLVESQGRFVGIVRWHDLLRYAQAGS